MIRSISLREANLLLPMWGSTSSVVSIGRAETSLPVGCNPENRHHLRLEFQDVEHPDQVEGEGLPPSSSHIQKLINYADILFERDQIFCHCWAGVSRSTACSFILRYLQEPGISPRKHFRRVLEERPAAEPNLRIIEIADELIGTNGKLIQTAVEFG